MPSRRDFIIADRSLTIVVVFQNLSSRYRKFKCLKAVKESIPLIGWLSKYNWKRDILGDVIAGITVAVMHIPQGKKKEI